MEYALLVLALIVGLTALTVRIRRGERRAWGTAAAVTALTLALVAVWTPATDELAGAIPAPVEGEGFVTSNTCRACHPREYATWHASYHRTMTQVARPDAVLGPFEGAYDVRGRSYKLSRRGAEFWVDMVDPVWEMNHRDITPDQLPDGLPRIRQRVVMTTGSHHLQAYWVQRPNVSGVYFQVPLIYLIKEQRWVATQDSFLMPPTEHLAGFQVWNTMCTACHTVATQPRMIVDPTTQEGSMFSRTAELGIACEACHGPAEQHVRANRWPRRRYVQHLAREKDTTVVNPKRLNSKRSTETCGQCHSFFSEHDQERWQVHGTDFRAGDELERAKAVFRYTENPTDPLLLKRIEGDPSGLSGRFWPDGTIRVAGREYNGLLESACYQKGKMSCLSCHSMHDYADTNDQLSARIQDDQSCLQCHRDYLDRVEQHTHHAPESSGSRCLNCHMPHTTYGLFAAIRSHRIDSPSVAVSVRTGRPNACNLCHVDQTLAWAAEHLSRWYAQPPVQMGSDEKQISAALLWLLKGDASQRVIAAWSLGWPEARQASGEHWQALYLAQLLGDPYAAVRQVAYMSLRKLPGFAALDYNFTGSEVPRVQIAAEAVRQWQRLATRKLDRHGERILIDRSAVPNLKAIDRIFRQRDDRPVSIVE